MTTEPPTPDMIHGRVMYELAEALLGRDRQDLLFTKLDRIGDTFTLSVSDGSIVELDWRPGGPPAENSPDGIAFRILSGTLQIMEDEGVISEVGFITNPGFSYEDTDGNGHRLVIEQGTLMGYDSHIDIPVLEKED